MAPINKTKRERIKKMIFSDNSEQVTITLPKSIIKTVDDIKKDLNVKSRSLMIHLILNDWVYDAEKEIKEYEKSKDIIKNKSTHKEAYK